MPTDIIEIWKAKMRFIREKKTHKKVDNRCISSSGFVFKPFYQYSSNVLCALIPKSKPFVMTFRSTLCLFFAASKLEKQCKDIDLNFGEGKKRIVS